MSTDRPKGVTATAWLMSITNAMGWFIVDWHRPRAYAAFALFTLFILAGYFVLWCYWQGRNWARIAVLLTSVLALHNLRYWPTGQWVRQTMLVSEAGLGAFLLYWLNTAKVRTYFKRS